VASLQKSRTQFKRDFRDQLVGQLESEDCGKFADMFDEYMRLRFVGDDMRPRLARMKDNVFDRYINKILEDKANNENLTYYYLLPLSDKPQVREKQRIVIEGLKKHYQHIVFLELSNDVMRILNEEDIYLPLTRYIS
jgi:hypothetical protein